MVHDRSLRGFLRAIRTEPGFSLRVAAAVAFCSSLALMKGLVTAFVAVAAGVAIGLLIGFPFYRRRGYLPTGTRR